MEAKEKATLEQVQLAIERLSDDDHLKLRHIAVPMCFGTSYREPQDLVQDAFVSALALRRRWNLALPFFTFMFGAMRSIAFNDRLRPGTKIEKLASELVPVDQPNNDAVLEHAAAVVQTQELEARLAEEEAEARVQQRAAELYALFDDEDVKRILDAVSNGCRGEEIRDQCGMTPKQYEAARKRMRNRINRSLAEKYPKAKREGRPAKDPKRHTSSPAPSSKASRPIGDANEPPTI